MRLLFKSNQQEFDENLPLIKEQMGDWQFMSIAISKKCSLTHEELMAKFIHTYEFYPGFAYQVGYSRIHVLVRIGKIDNYAVLKREVAEKINNEFCFINVRRVTEDLLSLLSKSYLHDDEQYGDHFHLCEERTGTDILVADDDPMVAKVMQKILGLYGNIGVVTNGDDVLQYYKEHVPDIVFLDIHMPGVNGLNNVEAILNYNPYAFVIVFSSDSVAPKILTALGRGAAGFIGKPLQKDRILDYLRLCPTTPYQRFD